MLLPIRDGERRTRKVQKFLLGESVVKKRICSCKFTVLRNFFLQYSRLENVPRRYLMAQEFTTKQIRGSLEVVAVYADHPPKIKLDTCFRVREISKCISSIINMHVPLQSSLFFYLQRVLRICLHMVFTSCGTLTLRVKQPVTTPE